MPSQRRKTEEDIARVQGLGRAVSELREKKGWNQMQLADRAALDFTTIYAVERGAMELTWGNVRRLAKRLEVDLDVLIECAEALAPGGGGDSWRLGTLVAVRERDFG